jgi:hypothetical protein
MKILQNLKIKEFPNFLPIFRVCLIAAALVSALSSTASDPAEFILGWDANEEADLDGYEIYFRKGAPGPTYNFLAEVYVDELEEPDNPKVTITDLDNSLFTDLITPVVRIDQLANNSTYHFALTAFDTQGKTSDFSEELCVEVIGNSVVECRSADSGADSDGFAEKSVVSGSGGADYEGLADNDADSGSNSGDNEGSADNDADSGSSSGDSDGFAEIGVDSGISSNDNEGSAEKSADSNGGGGGGCFITTSSFVYRETVQNSVKSTQSAN